MSSSDLSTYRDQQIAFLTEYLAQKQRLYGPDHPWASDVFERLLAFVPTGKLQRGFLIKLAYETFKKSSEFDSSVIKASAAMELFQAGVLIHDDIFDQDSLRRGQPSMYAQYQQLGQDRNFTSPLRTGESLAVCVGDIALFIVSELLASMAVSEVTAQIQAFFYHEIIITGLAEMHDVSLAVDPQPVTDEEIKSMYLYKTGHYTFCLPLITGAMLAQADETCIKQLQQFGEVIGVLFQIKDDELGLFGSTTQTGKAAISDVREGKKTLYYYHVLNKAKPDDRARLLTLFGNPNISQEDLEWVRQIVIDAGAAEVIATEMSSLEQQAQELVKTLKIPAEYQSFWHTLIAFNTSRRH